MRTFLGDYGSGRPGENLGSKGRLGQNTPLLLIQPNRIEELFCASRPYGVVSRPGRAYISPGRPFYPNTSHLVIFLVHLVVYLGLHLTWSSTTQFYRSEKAK